MLRSIIRKDTTEFFRTFKFWGFIITLLCTGASAILSAKVFPPLVDMLYAMAPEIITEPEVFKEMMTHLFPSDIRGSFEIFAADVVLFYGIVTIILTQGLIIKERKSGKWIMPLACGYKKRSLMLSKCIVYGVGTGALAFVFSILYYLVCKVFFTDNLGWAGAVGQSFVLGIIMLGSVVLTILLSVIYNNSVLAGTTMILLIVITPDLFNLFSFGKYLPTYLMTYTYLLPDEPMDLIIPVLGLGLVMAVMYIFAAIKIEKQ